VQQEELSRSEQRDGRSGRVEIVDHVRRPSAGDEHHEHHERNRDTGQERPARPGSAGSVEEREAELLHEEPDEHEVQVARCRLAVQSHEIDEHDTRG
jgi:hypothetical protein